MNIQKKRQKVIDLAKEFLKCSPVVQAMFEDYSVPISEISQVPIQFAPLDVSAKTKDKKVYINESLLEDGFEDDIHYIVHEICHYLQQVTGDVDDYNLGDYDDYLDLPTEMEAFAYQVQFMRDHYSEDVALDYVEDLLDFHEYKGKARKEKKDRLLGE